MFPFLEHCTETCHWLNDTTYGLLGNKVGSTVRCWKAREAEITLEKNTDYFKELTRLFTAVPPPKSFYFRSSACKYPRRKLF